MLLRDMTILFTPEGALRRPFGFLAGAAGYALVAFLGVLARI